MRFIGLDIGRDFAHVAVIEGSGTARRLPRLAMGDEFRGFAATLGPDDAVALEASTNTWALADLLGRHAGRVVVSNPLRTKAIASAKRKTDDIDAAERVIATMVVDDTRVRRLLTIPGIGLVTAASILAVVGDIGRFDRPAKLVSYLGLDPRIRQSGDRPAMRGHISRAGQAHARGLLCEAAHSAVRSPGPLAGFHARLKARRGGGVAIVATARKLAVIVWHLLSKDEDCRFAPEARTAFKQRQLDRLAGRPGTRSSHRGATGSSHDQGRARLRGGHDPHDPALRHAIDRVHPDGTPPSGA